jgi:hypothetical protein
LPRVTDIRQITSDSEKAETLGELYRSVDNIDLWVGALAEEHVAGGSVGSLLRAIIGDQFTRLRDGDRFWYQRVLTLGDRREVERTTLADLIRRNTELTTIQPNPFVFRPEVVGRVYADSNRNGHPDTGEPGLGGRIVELLDVETGDVIAWTVTDTDGSYRFGVEDGLQTGRYAVRLVPLPTAPPPPPDAPLPLEVTIVSTESVRLDLADPDLPI